MDVISPIARPLADEHVIGVDPPLKPDLPGVWRRRINPFTGRAISDKALTAEQEMRSGLQRLQALAMTPGVIEGLSVSVDPGGIGGPASEAMLSITPGLGLARSGEDVSIPSTRRVALSAIPIVVPVAVANALASQASSAPPVVPDALSEPTPPGGLERLADTEPLAVRLMPEAPRTVSVTLGDALGKPAAAGLPRVAVLVAQPVRAAITGRPRDDCPPDPRDDPYVDLQMIDGCRLLLFFWPTEMTARSGGAGYSLPPDNAAFRNQLAYRVFDLERSLQGSEMHPWEAWGVPLALVGLGDDGSLDFLDRSAVVRKGGAPIPRTAMVPQSGNPQLWQARIEQLVEHLAGLPDLEPETLRASLARIPPAGVLPGTSFDPATFRQSFFPGGFGVTATPIPLSDLELVVRESASLIPFHMAVADRVELLIPVPDHLYEPGLLQRAAVDGAFAEALKEFEANRARGLSRREFVRRRYDRLIEGVTGKPQAWPAASSPMTEINTGGIEPPLGSSRTRRFAAGAAVKVHSLVTEATLAVSPGDTLWFWMKVHDAAKLKGLSLRLAAPGSPPIFASGVYWGDPEGLEIAGETSNLSARKLGDLPPAGKWVRLEAPADGVWDTVKAALGGKSIAGVEWAQSGGDIEFGAFGKTDASGNEITWIADEAPGSCVFRTGNAGSAASAWPWIDVPLRDYAGIDEFGTSRDRDGRTVGALSALKSQWSQPFLAEDMERLAEVGLDTYLAEVEGKIAATNDAIDVGFIRARSDIYRVRQFMLGADSASRLVTSPSLADLAIRDEGARATSEGISKFIDLVRDRKAKGIDFDKPTTSPTPAAGTPTPTPSATPAASAFSMVGFNARFMTNNVAMASFVAPVSAPAPAPAPMMLAATVLPSAFAAPAKAVTPFAATPSIALAGTALATSIPAGPIGRAASPIVATPLIANRISLATDAYVPKDVRAQRPLPGLVERTISVAERLKPSPAVQALEFAIASKGAVLQTLRTLMKPLLDKDPATRPVGVPLGDLGVPGFAILASAPASTQAPTLKTLFEDQDKPAGTARLYTDLDVLIEKSDSKHESDYFTAAVNAIDNAIALMRLVEGRITLYESLADAIRDTREKVLGLTRSAASLLRELDVEVEEARHDIATAQLLLDEETARIEALRARRASILANNVGAIGYRRVREANIHVAAPLQDMVSGLTPPPLAACRRDHPEVPDELRRYTALLADAPAKWFPAIAAEVTRIDRLEAAREALEFSRKMATIAPALAFESRSITVSGGATRFLGGAIRALQAQQQTLVERRITTVSATALAHLPATLAELHSELKETSSLSDLAAGKHRHPRLATMASQQIAGFAEIGACLHAAFAEIAPAVRLAWAEILSEFDRPADLRVLAGLPQWASVPREDRRFMQGLVDILFGQIDSGSAKAVAYTNELVRVAMLLAAHSPVDRLITARLVREAPAVIGSRLLLAVDVKDARKGMVALIRDASDRLISKAVIDDVGDGQAAARIVANFAKVATIIPSMRIELSNQAIRLK